MRDHGVCKVHDGDGHCAGARLFFSMHGGHAQEELPRLSNLLEDWGVRVVRIMFADFSTGRSVCALVKLHLTETAGRGRGNIKTV
jgi:hypothetical protein